MSECDKEKIREYIKPISVDYDSPIRLFYQQIDNMTKQISGSVDEAVYQEVCKIGIDIDKEKLLSAIHHDRERYDEAFRKGYNKAQEDIVRCQDCKYGHPLIYRGYTECTRVSHIGERHENDWFCADAEKKGD